jgi:glycosyltransferase involved in cell wall biosynthesis
MPSPESPQRTDLSGNVCRVLFNVSADEDNYNAQSLNAREIALRLDPARFSSTLFFERTPDPRLARPGIRLRKLPARRKTPGILREMLRPHDFIVYIDLSPASYVYLHLPRFLRRTTRTVLPIEGSRGNLDDLSPTVRRYAEYVGRHADVRVPISQFLAQEMHDAFGLTAEYVIPVGVDTRLFTPPMERNHAVATVLFVGHLIERKGPQLVLQAARRFPDTRFRIIGQARDDFGRKLKKQQRESGIGNVSIEDPMPQAQLARILQQCDILLLPSRVEGVPKITLEAAAAGLPSVVFDDYQTPSVVNGKTGFQVKTFEEMLDRLQALIADASLRQRMSAAAVGHAKAFDWDSVGQRWSQLFLGTLNKAAEVCDSLKPVP